MAYEPVETGDFQCSHDVLNRIHRMAREMACEDFASAVHGTLPPPEQALMNYDFFDLYRLRLREMPDSETIPQSADRLSWISRIYQMAGDSSVIQENWAWMCRCMTLYEARNDPLSLYRLSGIMASCAQILGDTPLAEQYLAMQDRYQKEFCRQYANHPDAWNDPLSLSCAVCEDLLPEEDRQIAIQRWGASFEQRWFTPEMLGILSDNGYAGSIFRCVTQDSPWETNRQIAYKTDAWLYRYVGGLRPLSAGFAGIWVEPCFLPDVEWVRLRHGGVFVEWDRRAIRITTPVPGVLRMQKNTWRIFPGKHIFPRPDTND